MIIPANIWQSFEFQGLAWVPNNAALCFKEYYIQAGGVVVPQ